MDHCKLGQGGGRNARPPYLPPETPVCRSRSMVRTKHGTMDWFKIWKEVQVYVLSPCPFNFYAEYIMRNSGLDEAQAGIKIAKRNISNFGYSEGTILLAESEEELKSWLIKGERGEWKNWLETQYAKNSSSFCFPHFMVNSCRNNGNSDSLYFRTPKSLQMVTAAMKLKDACSL